MAVASLVINVMARTKDFTKGMNKASGGVKQFNATIKASQGLLRMLSFGLASVSVAGFAASIREAMLEVDRLAKTSQKLGVAIENLQALQFAGEQTGVSITTMNMALQRMTRRVSEAAQGTGEARGALKELGIEAAHLALLAPDAQMAVLADAMKRVSSQGDRVRLSMKLFDSEGVALVNTLKLGSEGLREMQREFESLGNVIDDDAAEKIQAANDSINKMEIAWKGVKNEAAVAFAPAIEGATELMVKLRPLTNLLAFNFNPGKSIADTLSGFGFKGTLPNPLSFLSNPFGSLATAFQTVGKDPGQGGVGAQLGAGFGNAVNIIVKKMIDAQKKLPDTILKVVQMGLRLGAATNTVGASKFFQSNQGSFAGGALGSSVALAVSAALAAKAGTRRDVVRPTDLSNRALQFGSAEAFSASGSQRSRIQKHFERIAEASELHNQWLDKIHRILDETSNPLIVQLPP